LPPAALARRLTYLLGRTAAVAGRRASQKLAALGFDTRHYAVLAAIGESAGPSQQEVAGMLGIDRATLVALADDLEGQGLIERTRSGQDRRAYSLRLTDAGTAAMNQADALMDECDDEVTRVLTAAERAQLAGMLARMFAAAS